MNHSGLVTIPFGQILSSSIRNGLSKPKAIRGSGVKMIGMGEIFKYNRIFDIKMDRVPVTDKELELSAVIEGDLLFARQSLVLEGAGKCSLVMKMQEDTVYESHLIRARVNPNIADSRFIFYYFNSYYGKENIKTIVEQVAAAGIRGSDLLKLLIPLPSLKTQRIVSNILSLLDDKIEHNRLINHNLAA